ncbi:MAG TPA: mucoidy inhibitor MuiA family protein [Hyphomicrobiaceae bacterium]|nr:mucoidy inhibitor MuiA family protein [Hyphomicrobiaceae bacterium]
MRCLVAMLVLSALFCVAEVEAAEVKGTTRIDAVTVFPSGAEVTRLGKVRLEAGDNVILFTDLPARAIHSSIRVEAKATGSLEIGSVDSRRTFLPRSDDAIAASERKHVEDAIEKLKDDRAVLETAVQAAEMQKALIGNLAQLPTHPAPLGGAAVPQPDWGQLLGLIGERLAEAQKVVLDAQIKVRTVDRQIKDLEGKLASLAPAQEERTEVKVFVNAGAALEAEVSIRYQIGGASWVPYYDARLTTGSKAQAPKLQLARRASIQQRTGESWDEVVLALSTARPGAGTAAPDLQPMTIDYEPDGAPARPTPVGGNSRSLSREAKTLATGQGEVDEESKPHLRAGVVPQQAEERFAKIETQAFQAIYSIAGRVSVPATGEAKRVQIDEAQLDPALAVRAVPKRDQKAFLYAKVTMARGTPILPGQVSLFRDGTFVGNGRLPLLSPGEEHELGFGVDDAVRVRHAVAEDKRAESGLITSSKTDTRSYRITVKNLHERAIPVTIIDQIPVAQNADIKIELLGKSAPTRRDMDDKRGLLAWDMDVKPDEEKVVEFGYRVTWPAAKKITYGQGS